METRQKAAAGAVALAAALAITGTWAYTNFVQKAVNDFDGESTPGVRLHDDFDVDAAKTAEPGDSFNKDVYVENYGEHPQFVRVQLSEFMSKDSAVVFDNSVKADKTTWHIHQPTDTELLAPSGDTAHTWWTWTLGGQASDGSKYYWHTDTTLAADHVDQDTSGKTQDELKAIYDNTGDPDHAKVGLTDQATVITMDAWSKLSDADKDALKGKAWVYDTDGWAYWTGPLATGEATGLLLDQVALSQRPEASEYYYGVNVKLQAATAEDIAKFADTGEGGGGGMTGPAAALLAYYAPEAPYIKANQGTVTHHVTPAVQFSLDLNEVFADPNYGDTLTFDLVEPVAGAAITGSTLTYTPTEGETLPVIQVQATDSTNRTSEVALVKLTFDAPATPSESAEPSESPSASPSEG